MKFEEKADQGFFMGYFYTINSTIGSGVLAIPWAYSQGGWLLGTVLQLFTAFYSIVLAYLLLQVMSRVYVLHHLKEKGYIIKI